MANPEWTDPLDWEDAALETDRRVSHSAGQVFDELCERADELSDAAKGEFYFSLEHPGYDTIAVAMKGDGETLFRIPKSLMAPGALDALWRAYEAGRVYGEISGRVDTQAAVKRALGITS